MNYNEVINNHNASLSAANADHNANSAALLDMLDAVNALSDAPSSGSSSLPILNNPAAPGDVLQGKEYITQDGTVGVGTSSGGNGAATCTLTCIGGSYAEYMDYCSPSGKQTLNWWDVGVTVELCCNSFVLFTGTQSATNITGSDGIELIFANYTGSVLIYIPNAPGAALELDLW